MISARARSKAAFRGGGRIAPSRRRVGDSKGDLQIELDRVPLGARRHSLERYYAPRELRRRLRRRGARHRQLPGAQQLTRRRFGQPGFGQVPRQNLGLRGQELRPLSSAPRHRNGTGRCAQSEATPPAPSRTG